MTSLTGVNQPPGDTIQILVEERQFHNDLKSSISSVISKVNDIYTKLDHSSLFQRN